MPDELWNEVYDIVQETGIKTTSMEKKCRKAKWLSGEALQIAVKRREVKSEGEKERYTHLNAEFQRIARRDKKRTTRVPEPERLGPGRCMQPRASLGLFPVEQPRARAVWAGRLHVP